MKIRLGRWRRQGVSEQTIDFFVKVPKKSGGGGLGGRVGSRGQVGGQGGCERRSEVLVKIQKKIGEGGFRVDLNKELKFL